MPVTSKKKFSKKEFNINDLTPEQRRLIRDDWTEVEFTKEQQEALAKFLKEAPSLGFFEVEE